MSHGKATHRPRKPIAYRALLHDALGLPLLMAVLAIAAALLLPVVHTPKGLPGLRPAATTLVADRQASSCPDFVVNNRRFSGGQH